jgi:hypothetical protein
MTKWAEMKNITNITNADNIVLENIQREETTLESALYLEG